MQNFQFRQSGGQLISLNFQQVTEDIKLTHIQSNHYFLLINKKYKMSLSYLKSQKYTQSHAVLAEVDQNDIQQIFQIQEIKNQKYQIVHANSTLVFTNEQNEVMLNFGKWKNNQFFYPQKINNNSQKLQYWIKTNKNSDKYVYYDGFAARCNNRNPAQDDTVWQIRLCQKNKQLNRSCWIQYAFSNQVIDIPEATLKSEVNLIQYPCNYRFNQRFYIREVQPKHKKLNNSSSQQNHSKYYMIQSLKTKQYLTVLESPFWTNVVQEPLNQKNQLNQLWMIYYQGNGLYTIKSVLKDNKFLIVKDRSTKLAQPLIISQNQNWCLWKIVGNFSIRHNKENKI